jgi:hypothetical protein
MAAEPFDDLRVFVRRTVIENDVYGLVALDLALDGVEEAVDFPMPAARHALSDDLSVQGIERREQSSRAIALVVVVRALATASNRLRSARARSNVPPVRIPQTRTTASVGGSKI